MRPAPNPAVMAWVAGQPAPVLCTTSITQAEILYGLRLLPAGRRRARLEAAAEAMFEDDFAGRVLAFDGQAARNFASIVAGRRQLGRPVSAFDGQIAAIAAAAAATVATANVADFHDCGVRVVDPWSRA
jgi:hypothetical protein